MQVEYKTSWADVMAKINHQLGYDNATVQVGTIGKDDQLGLVAVSVAGNLEYCIAYPTRQEEGKPLRAFVLGDKITPELVAHVQHELKGQ